MYIFENFKKSKFIKKKVIVELWDHFKQGKDLVKIYQKFFYSINQISLFVNNLLLQKKFRQIIYNLIFIKTKSYFVYYLALIFKFVLRCQTFYCKEPKFNQRQLLITLNQIQLKDLSIPYKTLMKTNICKLLYLFNQSF